MIVNNLVVREDKYCISFRQNEERCFVICSKQDEDTTLLLRKLGGLEKLLPSEEVQFSHNIEDKRIGFFFKRGILLSNLTLEENIALPYKYFFTEDRWAEFEQKKNKWIEFFKLDIDQSLRPAMVNHSNQKLISYIQNLILQPEILIIDDPFFQLSCIYRKKIVDCLLLLKEYNNFLVIGTSDIEIIDLLADDVIIMEKGEIIGNYELTGSNRESALKFVQKYLDD